MNNFPNIVDFFSEKGFMPHGHCYLWNPWILWTHVAADAVIGFSYVAISCTLLYLVLKVKNLPFNWMYLLFGVFIVSCGLTHFMDIWTVWTPSYWLDSAVRIVTAVASVGTAILLPPLVPKIRGLADHVQDLSKKERELRQSIEKVRESEMFLDSVIENIPNMIFIKEAENLKFVRFNKAGEQLLGRSRKELLGKNDFDFFPHDQAEFFSNVDREVLRGNRILDIPEEIIQTAQGLKILHTKKLSLKASDGRPQYLLGISEDITERKKAEGRIRKLNEELEVRIEQRTEELQIANKKLESEAMERGRYAAELERSNKELQQFVYIASHDLQEPLRAVSNYVQLLNEHNQGKLDAESTKYVRYVVEGASHMKLLIEDLLSFSRVGNSLIPKDLIDAEVAFDRALANLSATIQESNAVVTHDPLPKVRMVDIQLTQLFQNLIANAIKFHSQGKNPVVHISARQQNGQWIFSVKDNGIGIAPAYYDRIFLIFQRLHTRQQYPGSGVGLAICKKIVERHGGKIWVESAEGEGSLFLWSVPHVEGPDREGRIGEANRSLH